MAKQLINIGRAVDSGEGDYLRLGGKKLNSNFDDLYNKLGDDQNLFPAGAWKIIRSSEKSTINADFGQSYAVDTTGGKLQINLPLGNASDYGKVIKIRDIIGTFPQRSVTIIAASGNTIKGFRTKKLNRRWQDAELTFVSPGRWEYLENKLIDKLTNTDAPTIIKKEFVCQENQTDFINPFSENISYNTKNLMVYYRGNLLNYGENLTQDSDYGSIDPEDENNLLPLDGKTIRLRFKANLGDTVTLITFLDDPQVFQSSYVSKQYRVISNLIVSEQQLGKDRNGILYINPFIKRIFTRDDLGLSAAEGAINPYSLEVYVNGIQLVRDGEINEKVLGTPEFCCEIDGMNNYDIKERFVCEQQGGIWNVVGKDFAALPDSNGEINSIKFAEPFKHGDIVTIKWYNNTIGALLSEAQIDDFVSARYLSSDHYFKRTNRIAYFDINNPNELTKQSIADDTSDVRWASATDLLESIYPIGQIYMNANNPANPKDYMGFGEWTRFGEGRVLVGWNQKDPNDNDFGINNNANNNHSAGGTGGTRANKLVAQQIPAIVTDKKVLEKSDTGEVIIGQCQSDPSSELEGPGYKKYTEVNAGMGQSKGANNTVNNLMPYITVNCWLRIL